MLFVLILKAVDRIIILKIDTKDGLMFSLKKHAILFLPCLLTLMSGCVPEIEDLAIVAIDFSPAQNCGFAIANLDDTNNVWLNLAYAGIGSSLSAANNQKFTVYSMDIAEYSTVFAYEQTLVITCVKDGMQNFVDITLDGVITDSNDKFQTFDLSDSCSDIDELWFDAPMGVDNIRLSKLVSETKGIEATR